MPKTHRYAGATLKATTMLSRAEIGELTQRVAAEAHGNHWDSPGKVRFENAGADHLDFSVQSLRTNRELMTFVLSVSPGSGHMDLMTRIVTYKTTQRKMYGFIPVSATKMLGIAAYRDFMQRLGDAIEASDPRSTYAIEGV
jgi:hypothetical protein